MTTNVNVKVGGRYVATVKQTTVTDAYNSVTATSIVHGDYEGSPNPGGEKSFYLSHPALSTFEISEASLDNPAGT